MVWLFLFLFTSFIIETCIAIKELWDAFVEETLKKRQYEEEEIKRRFRHSVLKAIHSHRYFDS